MKCNVCGLEYPNASFGGLGICPACDCGINPEVTRLTAAIERARLAETQRDSLVKEIVELFEMGDTSYLHAQLHLRNAVLNQRTHTAVVRYDVEMLRKALVLIADGDSADWPQFSARRAAAVALGREEKDINREIFKGETDEA